MNHIFKSFHKCSLAVETTLEHRGITLAIFFIPAELDVPCEQRCICTDSSKTFSSGWNVRGLQRDVAQHRCKVPAVLCLPGSSRPSRPRLSDFPRAELWAFCQQCYKIVKTETPSPCGLNTQDVHRVLTGQICGAGVFLPPSLSLRVSPGPSLLHLLEEEKKRLFGDQIWSEKQSEKDLLVIVDWNLGRCPTSQKERECVRMTPWFSLCVYLCNRGIPF